jgi:hypothetical protein
MNFRLIIIIFLFFPLTTFAQDLNQSLSAPEKDSLALVASKQTNSKATEFSELSLRVGFMNRALSYGRDFGVEQSAMTASATYFHKTGLFASLIGYSYSQSDPQYSLTLLSLGYNGDLTDDLSYSLSYDRYFFNGSSGLINNGLNAFMNYDFGHFNVSASYGYMFGQEKAHNASLNLAGFWKIKDVGFIDKITFTPNISTLFGTESVPLGRFTENQFIKANQRPWLQRRLNNRNPQRPTPQPVTATTQNVFGLMAWNFAMPVRFAVGLFRLGITWSYVIPVKLPNEDYDNPTSTGFFNISLGYSIR